MKYCLEFGVRGGAHTENQVFSTWKSAAHMAASLAAIFQNDPCAIGATVQQWYLHPSESRATWQTETHFIALSKLDGVMRGPASAGLWRKDTGEGLRPGQVNTQ